MVQKLLVYTDGASRGNPGPAGIGYIVVNASTGGILAEHAEPIGLATNNEAEYRALVAALRMSLEYAPAEIACYSDSQVLTRQLTGEYRVRAPNLRPLVSEVSRLKASVARVSHMHLPREHPMIVRVDANVNRALNRVAGSGG